MLNVAFTGGGTGGHIYPGLAVASEFKRILSENGCNARLFWIGSDLGMDKSLVTDAGIEFYGVPSGKLRRDFSPKNIPDFFRVIAGFFAARKILKKNRPVILFSKGGFVSVPPCAAAFSLGIPVYTHESDFSPGLATKINARFVSKTGGKIFTAYQATAGFFPQALRQSVIVCGNPVRREFRSADPQKGRAFLGADAQDRILLVLGGSQGAAELNKLVLAALPQLVEHYLVVHQHGPRDWNTPAASRYKPFPYIKEEMPHVMAASELVFCRSGAGIVWEAASLGKPMLLLPLRGSGTRGDQVENASFFQQAGAADVLEEGTDSEILSRAVSSFAENEEKRVAMAHAAGKIGAQDGAAVIARILCEALFAAGKEEDKMKEEV